MREFAHERPLRVFAAGVLQRGRETFGLLIDPVRHGIEDVGVVPVGRVPQQPQSLLVVACERRVTRRFAERTRVARRGDVGIPDIDERQGAHRPGERPLRECLPNPGLFAIEEPLKELGALGREQEIGRA